MKTTYDLTYLLANRGTYSETHIRQLVGNRDEVLFSEIWGSSQIPYWEKLYFWLKNTELSNNQKLYLGVMLADCLCDSLIENYPDRPVTSENSKSAQPQKPYQPEIISKTYKAFIQDIKSYLTGNNGIAETFPGMIKSAAITNAIYRQYFSGDYRELGFIAINNVLNCFTPGYVQDSSLMSEFIESSVYASQATCKQYIESLPAEVQKDTIKSIEDAGSSYLEIIQTVQ